MQNERRRLYLRSSSFCILHSSFSILLMISPNGFHPQQIPGSDVRVVFSAGSIDRLGEIVSAEGGKRVLLVSDPGIREVGHEERAVRSLYKSGLVVKVFDEVEENPTIIHVGKGVIAARPFKD